MRVFVSGVKSSRPKWHRGQNFGLGLGLEALASALNIWPLPGLDLVVLLCNRAFFGQKSCKIPTILLNRMFLIIIWYFFIISFASALAPTFRNWPLSRSRPRSSDLGLGLEVLASFNITGFRDCRICRVTVSAILAVKRSATCCRTTSS